MCTGEDSSDSGVTILLEEAARRDMQTHALSSLQREVAGFMVGPWPEQGPDGCYVVWVQEYIPARFTLNFEGIVTITADSWRDAHIQLARRRPNHDAVMVGWFHTHPGMKLFLSDYDKFLHRSWWKQPWHVASVLDPVARAAALFAWDKNQTDICRLPFHWQWRP